MSKFLGPIHYLMYDLILKQNSFLDTLEQYILNTLKDKGQIESFQDSITNYNKNYPKISKLPLEEIIDHDNIHMWLSQRVQYSDIKFNAFIEIFKNTINDNINTLKSIAYNFGKNNFDKFDAQFTMFGASKSNLDTASDMFLLMKNEILDGMPCDMPFIEDSSTDKEIVLSIINDPHQNLFSSENLDIFYSLRNEWIKGFIGDDFEYLRTNDKLIIRKK